MQRSIADCQRTMTFKAKVPVSQTSVICWKNNHSQKVLSCRYNMDINRVEARFEDGTILSIDCIVIEDEYGNTPAQRAELDWLLI